MRVKFHFKCNLIWFSKDGKECREETVPCGCEIETSSASREPYSPRNAVDFTSKYRLESVDGGYYTNVFERSEEKIELLS